MPARRRKRKRAPSPEASCRWCGQSYDQTVCAVDWGEVWKEFAVARKEANLGRPLTDAERDAVGHGSDPCDDCCCGACGQRKRNGAVCC
jgi:hypothetical protein